MSRRTKHKPPGFLAPANLRSTLLRVEFERLVLLGLRFTRIRPPPLEFRGRSLDRMNTRSESLQN